MHWVVAVSWCVCEEVVADRHWQSGPSHWHVKTKRARLLSWQEWFLRQKQNVVDGQGNTCRDQTRRDKTELALERGACLKLAGESMKQHSVHT